VGPGFVVGGGGVESSLMVGVRGVAAVVEDGVECGVSAVSSSVVMPVKV
jgi:hypothetical protein